MSALRSPSASATSRPSSRVRIRSPVCVNRASAGGTNNVAVRIARRPLAPIRRSCSSRLGTTSSAGSTRDPDNTAPMGGEEGYFGERVAAVYDEHSATMFDPAVVEPAVERLGGPAGGGAPPRVPVGTRPDPPPLGGPG